MIQVKLIRDSNPEELEYYINDWIQDNKDIKVFDIKYQFWNHKYSAMIIYYDNEKLEKQ